MSRTNNLINLLAHFFLVVTFLLAMHYYPQSLGGTGLEHPSNNLVLVGATLFALTALYYAVRIKGQLVVSTFFLCTLFMFAALLIPLLYPNFAAGSSTAQFRLTGLAWGLLILVSVHQLPNREQLKKTLLLCVVAAAGIESLVGLWQMSFVPHGGTFLFAPNMSKPVGTFNQPNVFGSFLATGVVCGLYLLINRTKQKFNATCYLIAISNFLIGLVLFSIGSRSAMISVLVAPAILLLIHRQWIFANKRLLFLWLIPLLAGLLINSLFAPEAGSTLIDKYQQAGARISLYQVSAAMFLDSPWIGQGYGSFLSRYLEFQAQLLPKVIFTDAAHPHNELVLWAVEGGVLPLLALLLIAVVYLRILFKVSVAYAFSALTLLFPITFHTALELPLHQSLTHWFVFVLLLSLFDTSTQRSYRLPSATLPTYSIVAVALAALSISLAVTNLRDLDSFFRYIKLKDSSALEENKDTVLFKGRYLFAQMNADVMKEFSLIQPSRPALEKYVAYAEQEIHHNPRVLLYINLLKAHYLMNNDTKARYYFEAFRRLYPEESPRDQVQFINWVNRQRQMMMTR